MASEARPDIPIPYKEVSYTVRIGELSQDEKIDLLSNLFLKLEHKHLREPHRVPQVKPEAKIMFLTGGPKSDVTEARDFEGNLIHTRHLNYPRPMFAEIPEALSSISHWFDLMSISRDRGGNPPSPVAPLSEVADVVYNISHLLTLDPNFYENYNVYLNRIADSLGYQLDQLLTVALYKYNFRLGQGKSQKDIAVENAILENLLKQKTQDGSPLVPIPSENQFQQTFHTLSEVQSMLNTRLAQLKQADEWQKNKPLR
jgi:hypothetical protein